MDNTNNSVFNLSIMKKYNSEDVCRVNSFVLGECSVLWYIGVKDNDMYLCEITLQEENKATVFKAISDTFDYGLFFNDAYQAAFDYAAKIYDGIKAGKTTEEAITDLIC